MIKPPATASLAALFLGLGLSATATAATPTATAATTTTTTTSTAPGADKAGTTVTSSTGLIFQLVKPGTGAQPTASDQVKVHYRGTLMDGTEFDSSYKRGEPAKFPLNRVIPCWTEGVQLMKVGATAKLTCPPAIAYGKRGAGGGLIPADATLRFDIELIAIER